MVDGVIDGQLILSTRLSPGHIFLLSFCAQTISFLSFFVANFAFLTYTTAFTIQIFDGYGFVYKLYTTYRVAQGNTTPVQSAAFYARPVACAPSEHVLPHRPLCGADREMAYSEFTLVPLTIAAERHCRLQAACYRLYAPTFSAALSIRQPITSQLHPPTKP